jgi:hypothetical protein
MNPIKPNGGGIRNATSIPIPANIMPFLVQNGHPPAEQDWPFFIEGCFSITKRSINIYNNFREYFITYYF